jgi:hypothetical protein
MIIYDFIERRLDEVECSDGWHAAQNMVDSLLDSNITEFKQENQLVDDICNDLYHELESIANEDIPF